MAIDTSLFGVSLPAGTYTAGDIIPLANLRGPKIVRDGYGTAVLKRVTCGLARSSTSSIVIGHVIVKNSNWVDSIANIAAPISAVSLAETSSNIQRGHECKLVPNSGWELSFVVDVTVTTTDPNDVFALIDIDYPNVQAVQNPRLAAGTPITIMRNDTVTINAFGSIASATWVTYNVDFLKAGSRYLLTELGSYNAAIGMGFVSISGAAGQNGLERIIPVVPLNAGYMRYLLDYSTPLVKGPMNLNYLMLGTAGTGTAVTEIDWVKA